MLDHKAQESEDAEDPRNFNALVEALLRDVSDNPDAMAAVLQKINDAFCGRDQSHSYAKKEKPAPKKKPKGGLTADVMALISESNRNMA